MRSKWVVFVLVFLFFSSVSALGITPGRTSFNFDSAEQKQVSFSVLNTEGKNFGVVFAVRGDLAEYVRFDVSSADFSSGEVAKSFSYTLNLPASFATPGLHEAEILALETAPGSKELGTSVGASVAVASTLQVYVPYPHKYLEADLSVVEQGATLNFIVPLINRGKLDVVHAQATIDIFNGFDEKIATLTTNADSLLSLERKELVARWEPGVNPGRYKAVVTVRYDNEVTSVLKEFNLGELFLEIVEVNVRDFELGEIARFNALVENKWSSALRDVYLNILIYNAQGEIMADFKSPTYDIDALARSDMLAYWDTAGVREGTYDGKLILRYGEKQTEKEVSVKISQYDLEVVGLTGQVLAGGGGSLNMNTLLLLIVGVLVVANIVWFVLIKRILKKRK